MTLVIEILQEITDWGTLSINNGIYHIDSSGNLVAYQPSKDAKLKTFTNPLKAFSKARRKFVKIGEVEEQLADDVIIVQGSNGNTYTIQDGRCSCPGYTYRGNCKHVKQLH